jgi:hypothetical protein
MCIGFTLPQLGHRAHQAQQISRFTAEAERLLCDHCVFIRRLLARAYMRVDPVVSGFA